MNFKRQLYSELDKWKRSPSRKPLVLRGARQVGKTTLVKEFASSYQKSILLNLERPSDAEYFTKYQDARTLLDALFLKHGIEMDRLGTTLLFIDEIQESTKAIQMLRFFYEDIPTLHVIAAGSLLEFSLHKVKSFPVGRIEYMYLHPLNFHEYLMASGKQSALEQLEKLPVENFAHGTLMDLFNQYAIIGGMPEVVKEFLATGHVSALPRLYEGIWSTYRTDVEKYAKNNTERNVIKHIMSTAHLYVDQRVKFQNFGNSNYRSREVGEAMRNLDDAKVIRLIYPTTNVEAPIMPDVKKSPRLQFLDTGLLNHNLNIQSEMLGMKDLNETYKGSIIPHLITQELISLNTISNHRPNFWVREKNQASSEVDIVYNYRNNIIPIEIKSGSIGKLKSLIQFIERAPHPYTVRMYAGKFSIEEHSTPSGKKFFLMNLPYYLGTRLADYIGYLVNNYQ